jgi:hypothetical protein
MLYVEHKEPGIQLTSSSNASSYHANGHLKPYEELTVRAEYNPESKVMTTFVNGEAQIRHPLEASVLAQFQVQFGRNAIVRFFTHPEFRGTLGVLERRIEPGVPVA